MSGVVQKLNALPLHFRAAALGGIAALFAIIKHFRLPRNVRYAKGDFLLGRLRPILKGLFNNTLHDDFAAQHAKLGPTYAMHVAGEGFVHTTDPRNIEHILKTNFSNYPKGSIFQTIMTDLLGKGIFAVDGEGWYKQRKIASKLFTKKIFENHIWKVIDKQSSKVCEVLGDANGKTVCMFSIFNRVALDMIGEIGFSRNINSLENPSLPFLKAFDDAQGVICNRFWTNSGVPLWRIARFFGLAWEKDFPKQLRALHEYSDEIVAELIVKNKTTGGDPSFMGLFMEAAASHGLEFGSDKEFRVYMRDMVLNFLIAGRDTTAQALTWTLFELMQHPEVMEKVLREIQDVVGAKALTMELIKELRYTKAAVDEGLRLHPSVPVDTKVCEKSDVFPDGAIIPAGTLIQYTLYSQGRCTKLWGSDAASFRPERWLERTTPPSSFEYAVFNAGPRECLGKRLAELEMMAVLAKVLPRFDFALAVKPEDICYDNQVTLGCRSGLPAHVKDRQRVPAGAGA